MSTKKTFSRFFKAVRKGDGGKIAAITPGVSDILNKVLKTLSTAGPDAGQS